MLRVFLFFLAFEEESSGVCDFVFGGLALSEDGSLGFSLASFLQLLCRKKVCWTLEWFGADCGVVQTVEFVLFTYSLILLLSSWFVFILNIRQLLVAGC